MDGIYFDIKHNRCYSSIEQAQEAGSRNALFIATKGGDPVQIADNIDMDPFIPFRDIAEYILDSCERTDD